MREPRVPAALFSAVKRDLRPVRPLASPARRALALVPVAIVLLVGMPIFWAWQTQGVIAPWSSWGLSALETALSLVILAAGFREAVPGRELSARALSVLICVACIGKSSVPRSGGLLVSARIYPKSTDRSPRTGPAGLRQCAGSG